MCLDCGKCMWLVQTMTIVQGSSVLMLFLVMCPVGTFGVRDKCTLCPQHTYQDRDSSSYCKTCDSNSKPTITGGYIEDLCTLYILIIYTIKNYYYL